MGPWLLGLKLPKCSMLQVTLYASTGEAPELQTTQGGKHFDDYNARPFDIFNLWSCSRLCRIALTLCKERVLLAT
jgi:hypothetical protein